MAIISNFELLLKPIAPPVGPSSEVARVVVQGYFLEISNLESRDIKLIFRTRTSVRQTGDSVNTEFTNSNNVVAYDITQDNLFNTRMTSAGEQIPTKQLGHFVNCLIIPAGQTSSLAVLPNVQAILPSPNPDLAIRGYTELVLSSDIDSFSPLTFSAPQSARILVSPEHRGTFIDPQFDPANPATQTGLDFDQLAYSLPTANGKALQVIDTHAPFDDPFNECLTSDFLSPGRTSSAPVALSDLSRNLAKDANAPERLTAFRLGGVPVQVTYSIKNGNYRVEEEGISKAINTLIRRRRISKRSVGSMKTIVKKINAALSGNQKANAQIQKIFGKLEK